jgi:glucose-1-phosphate cytidylyltransferase
MNISNFKKELTVVILCGGKGLRLRPLTKELPKPLIKINEKSILENIIKYFLDYKIKNFIIATGYKSELIDEFIKKKFKKYNIKTIYTGLNSDIIKRLKKSSEYSKKYFLVCYGDTMVNIDLNKYIKFYLNNIKKILVASYQLKSGFGILDIVKNNDVVDFKEKPILDIWFNVGYFIFSSDRFYFFKKFKRFQDLLRFLSKKNLMRAYKHNGNHITVNTVTELEIAKQKIKKFN